MGQLTLYLGGAKSGKTRLALSRAETWPPPRIYLATAQALDGEMAERIRRHQAERGPQWQTLESPLTPDQTLTALADHFEARGLALDSARNLKTAILLRSV